MESCMVQPKSIQNKADALHFAVLATMKYECGVGSIVDYEEAKKLFDFFCANVEFPEDATKKMLGSISPIIEGALNAKPSDLENEFSKMKEEWS